MASGTNYHKVGVLEEKKIKNSLLVMEDGNPKSLPLVSNQDDIKAIFKEGMPLASSGF